MISDEIRAFITEGKDRNATDIHICADTPVMFRIDGKLRRATRKEIPP